MLDRMLSNNVLLWESACKLVFLNDFISKHCVLKKFMFLIKLILGAPDVTSYVFFFTDDDKD